jgi:chromate transport protein ChrA
MAAFSLAAAFLLMMILSALYACARGLPAVVSAFSGLQAIIVGIVAEAVVLFGRGVLKNLRDADRALGWVLLGGMQCISKTLSLLPGAHESRLL